MQAVSLGTVNSEGHLGYLEYLHPGWPGIQYWISKAVEDKLED